MNRLNKTWWLRLFFVVSAMMVGIWVPLRLLYFHNLEWVDRAVDAITFTLVAAHYWFIWRGTSTSVSSSKMRLAFDLMIAIPFDWMASAAFGAQFEVLMLVKILLLKRLSYVKYLLDAFAGLHPIVYRLIPLVLFMPMLVHLVACTWIALGSGTAGPDADHIAEYIKAVYWTFTTLTTVGYGDISAKTPVQMLLACGTQVAGVGVFGFILSNVASILARLDAARDHHLERLDKIENFMNYNHLPPELKSQIRSYYRYVWDAHHGYDDSEVLNELPGPLKAKIAMEINRTVIERVPMFVGAESDLLQDIVMQFTPHICVPGEKLFHVDEPGDSMYFIHTGEIEIISRTGQVLATLKPGSFFGEMALLTENPRTATARAKTYCDLFVLSRESFTHVAHRYPEFEAHLHEILKERTNASAQAAKKSAG